MEDGKKSGVVRRRLYCSFKQHHLRLSAIKGQFNAGYLIVFGGKIQSQLSFA